MSDETTSVIFNTSMAGSLDVVVAQLLDAALELEELAAAGYVLDRPVEADGIRLSRAGTNPRSAPGSARDAL